MEQLVTMSWFHNLNLGAHNKFYNGCIELVISMSIGWNNNFITVAKLLSTPIWMINKHNLVFGQNLSPLNFDTSLWKIKIHTGLFQLFGGNWTRPVWIYHTGLFQKKYTPVSSNFCEIFLKIDTGLFQFSSILKVHIGLFQF